jgi:hypothetical protein
MSLTNIMVCLPYSQKNPCHCSLGNAQYNNRITLNPIWETCALWDPFALDYFRGSCLKEREEDEYGKINAPWCCSASDEKLRNSSDLMLFS